MPGSNKKLTRVHGLVGKGWVNTIRTMTAGQARRGVQFVVALAILASAGAAYWYWSQTTNSVPGARPAARAAVPVTVAVATRQDVPLYLTGLGTVQASATVKIFCASVLARTRSFSAPMSCASSCALLALA